MQANLASVMTIFKKKIFSTVMKFEHFKGLTLSLKVPQ